VLEGDEEREEGGRKRGRGMRKEERHTFLLGKNSLKSIL
jgi:hypothetical protein